MDGRHGKSLLLFPLAGLLCCGLALFFARAEEAAPKKEAKAETKDGPAEKKESPPEKKDTQPFLENPAAAQESPPDVIAVAPPPFSPGIFPCSGCHDEDLKVNPLPHQLTRNHKEIVLKHGGESRWCLDCHTITNFDKLHLAGGKLIDFTESYKLCGQCHGERYRDWRAGEHGKRTGCWSGKKEYLLCASCHNPHSPHFRPLKPLPPPVRPQDLR